MHILYLPVLVSTILEMVFICTTASIVKPTKQVFQTGIRNIHSDTY